MNHIQYRTKPPQPILSPVYQNKAINVLDSPIHRRSLISNLPFQSIPQTPTKKPPKTPEIFKKKSKQLKNVNKSTTVSQPSLNTSLRNRSYLSNENLTENKS